MKYLKHSVWNLKIPKNPHLINSNILPSIHWILFTCYFLNPQCCLVTPKCWSSWCCFEQMVEIYVGNLSGKSWLLWQWDLRHLLLAMSHIGFPTTFLSYDVVYHHKLNSNKANHVIAVWKHKNCETKQSFPLLMWSSQEFVWVMENYPEYPKILFCYLLKPVTTKHFTPPKAWQMSQHKPHCAILISCLVCVAFLFCRWLTLSYRCPVWKWPKKRYLIMAC